MYLCYLYINLACRSSFCLHPINVKTAEPIGPKFCVGPHVTPGKAHELKKNLKICVSNFNIFVKF